MGYFKELIEGTSNLNKDFLDKKEFVKEINALRKKAGSSWYTYTGNVIGKEVKLKGYQTWLQVYEVDGVDHSTNMEISVKEFKQKLEIPL